VTQRELEKFTFSAPKNPSQSIIDLFKRYVPGKTDEQVVSRITRENPASIAYAFYSLIEETRQDDNPFENNVQEL
jgi:hypothetical protein